MAANTIALNQVAAVSGLGTTTFNVVSAGFYTVSCQSTLPAGSGLQIVIALNGSSQVTVGGVATNPTPSQPSIGTSARINCAAADALTVVLSSSNAIDSQKNAVKSIINVFQGE